jgi:hypothetical protein
MTGRLRRPLQRLAAMDRGELGFRAASEARKAAGRLGWAVRSPRWDRTGLASILRGVDGHPALDRARTAARAGRWMDAHRALAGHFAARATAFPLEPARLDDVTARIRARFPGAPDESRARAARMLEGRYDLLGYVDLPFGAPPRWHWDPVHERTAPNGFWAAVPYLDPASGDHKIIWELNRHQHWLAFARAFHLTGERRFYDAFVEQLGDWMQANPPLAGVNWASMLELGFRSLSWLWALHSFAPIAAARPADERAPWLVDLLIGLDRQLTHIERNLSRYFSPNTHLTGEALAIYVAGLTLPELRASGARAALARDVLVAESARQVRRDGGHAERSAHYHRYSTDFYLMALQVARAGGDPAASTFEQSARAQARCLRTLADDDGRLPLIGDDDGGQLFPMCGRPPADCRATLATAAVLLDEPALATDDAPEETYWQCGSRASVERAAGSGTAWPSAALTDTGYVVSRTRSRDHLVFDAGAHGYLNGGHAHSDALAVALTVGGRPLLVDPGTGTYTMDARLRDLFRSTAMHNTVVVNGRPQSEPRGPFHWRTRCDAELTLWHAERDFDYAEGRHEAYAPVVHVRSVAALHGLGWFIVDHLVGRGKASADAHWHLDPAWQVESATGATVALRHRDGTRQVVSASNPLTVVDGDAETLGLFAPVYGRVERAPCLRVRTAGAVPRSVLTFIPGRGMAGAAVAIAHVPLEAVPPPGWHAAAFEVVGEDTRVMVLTAVEADGAPGQPLRGPGIGWGTKDVRTDARAAVIVSERGSERTRMVRGTVHHLGRPDARAAARDALAAAAADRNGAR